MQNLVANVSAKKLFGTVFHLSPVGEKHKDMLNNLFAPIIPDDRDDCSKSSMLGIVAQPQSLAPGDAERSGQIKKS